MTDLASPDHYVHLKILFTYFINYLLTNSHISKLPKIHSLWKSCIDHGDIWYGLTGCCSKQNFIFTSALHHTFIEQI